MKLKLKESDFEEHWISFQVPVKVFENLHFHPCEMEVDLSELHDSHKEVAPEQRNGATSTNKHYTKCRDAIYADSRTEDYSREEVLNLIKKHFA